MAVFVGVAGGGGVIVSVGVRVGVRVVVGGRVVVGVHVGVKVREGWPVTVLVGVFTVPPVVTTSLGAVDPDSRLPNAVAVLLAEVIAKLINPSPLTNPVTSTLTHAPLVILPEVLYTLPIAGILL